MTVYALSKDIEQAETYQVKRRKEGPALMMKTRIKWENDERQAAH